MSQWKTLADIRREYGDLCLTDDELLDNPFEQFKRWFDEVLPCERYDPTAMVLSTVDENGLPDSRVVLLKGLSDDAFIFYTNYESTKSLQLKKNPLAALNFYWPQMARQVRIRGPVKPTSKKTSDEYFTSRPLLSQLSAIASPQSREIASRKLLDEQFNQLLEKQGQKPVIRPQSWGGYLVIPTEIEFWQGRDNRLHDRIHYFKTNDQWYHRRLAP